ncbi:MULTISPECIES: benenodin family lasso peptide [Rhodanobacter]|nr:MULTISPECIES: benenodin family lasso peptide [Rhodanobacter]UJJ51510.1 benenodin family lasso peptide [Rhodanobacter denitrificans]UJJ59709.1 benenodin family lasso peptide [Rhodanobacter denitrificans]UJM94255.1 benenodin family lasso peptide [Rhodanobacter denitrificans]UJM97784.1 benenodin family lasso peptide [Rhodanobacter denitrificans]UJN22801.1 benenodin family lasso peptide [Rhodanobacter denitrificans]
MNTNENIRNDTPEEVIVLGVASVETKGQQGIGEVPGTGGPMIPGISEE